MKENRMTLGQRLRAIRQHARLTLKEMSQRSEIPVSTLSKVEHDTLSLSYQQLASLIERLHLNSSQLFEQNSPTASISGWRSIQRGSAMAYHTIGAHEFGYACSELRQKKMKPVVVRLGDDQATKHEWHVDGDGDEYFFVLEGSVEVSTQLYAPVVLNAGDSIYLDSRIEHSYAAAKSTEVATALIVCSGQQEFFPPEPIQ